MAVASVSRSQRRAVLEVSMDRNIRRAALVVALAVCAASPAIAVDEPMREFGLLLGAGILDSTWTGQPGSLSNAAPVLGLRYAYILPDRLALFADITYERHDTAQHGATAQAATARFGPELLLPWMTRHSRFFVAGAVGWLGGWTSHAESFNRPLVGLGFGQRFVTESSNVLRWELRADTTLGHSGLQGKSVTNAQFLIGWSLGNPQPDSDLDGVPDYRDRCRATPRGWPVDANGCPTDSDGDGVPDAIDHCPNTPKGWPVDERGCPLDSDRDGVPDGADHCPNTPAGVKVDVHGCPLPTPRSTPTPNVPPHAVPQPSATPTPKA
jgi:OOP family OmpA-OmpF porin